MQAQEQLASGTAVVQKWKPNNINLRGEITGPLDVSALLPAVEGFNMVASDIDAAMIERTEELTAISRAIICKSHVFLLGVPGVGKSMLLRFWADRLSTGDNDAMSVFIYLMSRFTRPDEIFGPVSVSALKMDRFRFVTTDRASEADFILLDEIGKAGSTISNMLLMLMNERFFINDGRQIRVPLQSLFGASNELFHSDEQAALYDRFLFRLYVQPLTFSGRMELRRRKAANIVPQSNFHLTRADLSLLQDAAPYVFIPDDVLTALGELDKVLQSGGLASKGIGNSDRRWGECLRAVQATALLAGRGSADSDDLIALGDVLWNVPDERRDIMKAIGRLANPVVQKIQELADQAHNVYEQAVATTKKNGPTDDGQTMLKASRALATIRREINQEEANFKAQNKKSAKVDRAVTSVREWTAQIQSWTINGYYANA